MICLEDSESSMQRAARGNWIKGCVLERFKQSRGVRLVRSDATTAPDNARDDNESPISPTNFNDADRLTWRLQALSHSAQS